MKSLLPHCHLTVAASTRFRGDEEEIGRSLGLDKYLCTELYAIPSSLSRVSVAL